MKICILNIATNKYMRFVDQLLNSIQENFLNGHEISVLLFTDHEIQEVSDNIKVCKIDHEPWPIPTLKRYHYFLREKEYISQFDYCFYLDVDMRIVDKVGEEIFGDLVATQHAGYYHKDPVEFAYERRPNSTAYIPEGQGKMYYAGGFNGGKPSYFLKMAETIVNNVDKDFEQNIIAVCDDESHMNRYLLNQPPTLELTPSYCYPESGIYRYGQTSWHVPFEPKIIALDKNHAEVRS